MTDYCVCGEPADEDTGRCPECEKEYQWQLAHYGRLYRAGALEPAGPWKSRDDLIREAGARDD